MLEVTQRDGAHAVVTIWNPDGSTAEMSGNGVRIAARWLAAESGATEVTIETAGRQVSARMLNALDTDTDVGAFTVGSPESVDGIELTTASVGNPHAVVRLDDPTRDDLLRLGPLIETHPRFPDRTNVQLVRVDGRHDLTVLVWERGAGETSASASSAARASSAAGATARHGASPVRSRGALTAASACLGDDEPASTVALCPRRRGSARIVTD